jgi:phosphoglycolate phosphatase-like HAD superfamily hydrolase
MNGLRAWIQRESRLGNPALEEEVKNTPDPDLQVVLEWSRDVNAAVEKIVRDVPPFPLVRECLGKLEGRADAIVVSQTPIEALVREWKEHALHPLVRMIAGQEHGTKTEHIALATNEAYANEKILMIGDAPGDYRAARSNKALFFPINPGAEEESWRQLYEEALDRFFAGTFAGEYQKKLLADFDACLPEEPSW